MGGRQEVDLGRGMHGALAGESVWRERHGQLRVEQLQPLLLGRQAEDLVLQALVLLLQGVERLQHLHDCREEGHGVSAELCCSYSGMWREQRRLLNMTAAAPPGQQTLQNKHMATRREQDCLKDIH